MAPGAAQLDEDRAERWVRAVVVEVVAVATVAVEVAGAGGSPGVAAVQDERAARPTREVAFLGGARGRT